MSTLEEEREEFKKWYKLEKIQRTGVWTEDDERQLRLEMQTIENNSNSLALVITGVELALAIGLIMYGFHLIGII